MARRPLARNRRRGNRLRFYGPLRRMAAGRSRLRRSLPQPVQVFKRSQFIPSAVVVAPGIGYTFGAYSFNLNGVPAMTDFTALYDQYKITGIKWTLIPKFNSVDMQPPGGGALNNQTQVFTVLDFDDINAPGTIDTLMEYQNMKMTRGGSLHSRYLKPKILRNVWQGAAAPDGHESIKSPWLDAAYPAITHYGLKYAIQKNNLLGQEFDLKIDYYLAFKNVH